jgi:hypothetical protein
MLAQLVPPAASQRAPLVAHLLWYDGFPNPVSAEPDALRQNSRGPSRSSASTNGGWRFVNAEARRLRPTVKELIAVSHCTAMASYQGSDGATMLGKPWLVIVAFVVCGT